MKAGKCKMSHNFTVPTMHCPGLADDKFLISSSLSFVGSCPLCKADKPQCATFCEAQRSIKHCLQKFETVNLFAEMDL